MASTQPSPTMSIACLVGSKPEQPGSRPERPGLSQTRLAPCDFDASTPARAPASRITPSRQPELRSPAPHPGAPVRIFAIAFPRGPAPLNPRTRTIAPAPTPLRANTCSILKAESRRHAPKALSPSIAGHAPPTTAPRSRAIRLHDPATVSCVRQSPVVDPHRRATRTSARVCSKHRSPLPSSPNSRDRAPVPWTGNSRDTAAQRVRKALHVQNTTPQPDSAIE